MKETKIIITKKKVNNKAKPLVVAIVVDRSGSMSNQVSDVIGGVNTFLETLKEDKTAPTNVSIITFDTVLETLAENSPVETAPKLTSENYFARGGTSLLDAVKHAIEVTDKYVATCKKKPRVLLHISTDGQENSSKTTSAVVKTMVEERKKSGWIFVFGGQGIDAWSTGTGLGFANNYNVGARNMGVMYASAGASANMMKSMDAGTYRDTVIGTLDFYAQSGTSAADLAKDNTDQTP